MRWSRLMIRSDADGRPRTIGRGPSGRKGVQTAQERISRRSRFRRCEAATRVRLKTLFGGTDRAPKDEMIAVAFTPVSGVIDQRPQDMQAESTNRPVCNGRSRSGVAASSGSNGGPSSLNSIVNCPLD